MLHCKTRLLRRSSKGRFRILFGRFFSVAITKILGDLDV
ncbi:hypothetical protein PORCAN_1941 [Porphyromonas crevioricanis JCM 13913]|nr:hypothetical protein PORCAN_1941 [Porphyromonas crevioricanis JCM 13913]